MHVESRALLPFLERFQGEVEMSSLLPESGWEVATIEISSGEGLSETLRELRNRSAAMGCDLVVVDRFETVWQPDENVTVDCGTSTCTSVNRERGIVERLVVHGRGFSRHREGTMPSLDSR